MDNDLDKPQSSPVESDDEVDAFERGLRAERRYGYGLIATCIGATAGLGGIAGMIWLASQPAYYQQSAGRAWGALVLLTGTGLVAIYSGLRTLLQGETLHKQ